MIEFHVGDRQGAISAYHMDALISDAARHDEDDLRDTVKRLSGEKGPMGDLAKYLRGFYDDGDIEWEPLEEGDNIDKSVYDHPMRKFFGPHPLFSDNVLSLMGGDLHNILWGQYDGVSKANSDAIGKLLFKRVSEGDMSIRQLVKDIQSIDPSIDDSQAEAIARTETTVLVNKGRELMWQEDDPTGDRYLYKMVGPEDHRTCWAHEQIGIRQGKGMPLPALKALAMQIFQEAQNRGDFKSLSLRDNFGYHPHQRWVLIRGEKVE